MLYNIDQILCDVFSTYISKSVYAATNFINEIWQQTISFRRCMLNLIHKQKRNGNFHIKYGNFVQFAWKRKLIWLIVVSHSRAHIG